jgi:serine protease Do
MRSLPRLVARAPIDQQVDVEVVRKGERKTLQVKVGRLSEEDEARTALAGEGQPGPETVVLGLTLQPLTDELRAKHGIGAQVKGAIVSDVDPTSPAAANIKPGDVIVQAANEPVSSPQDIANSVASVKKGNRKTVMLEVEDAKGSHRFVSVPVE